MSKKIKAIAKDEVIESDIITIQLPNLNEYQLFYDKKRDGLILYKTNAGRKHVITLKDTSRQVFIK